MEAILSNQCYLEALYAFLTLNANHQKILKWEAFWAEHISNEWVVYKDAIKKLRLKLCSKVSKDVIATYDELWQIIGKMKTEMENFESECSQKSAMCKYVLQGLKLINLVEILVPADRDGNLKLHMVEVGN